MHQRRKRLCRLHSTVALCPIRKRAIASSAGWLSPLTPIGNRANARACRSQHHGHHGGRSKPSERCQQQTALATSLHTLCAACVLTAARGSASMQKIVREALPPDIRIAGDAFDLIIECCTGASVAPPRTCLCNGGLARLVLG